MKYLLFLLLLFFCLGNALYPQDLALKDSQQTINFNDSLFHFRLVPGYVSDPIPTSGAINVPLTQELSWLTPQGGETALSYKIRIGLLNPLTTQWHDLGTSSSWLPTFLLSNSTQYFWQVMAYDATGETPGPIWNFTTIIKEPDPVVNIHPLSGSLDIPIEQVLSWQAPNRAEGYKIKIGSTEWQSLPWEDLGNVDVWSPQVPFLFQTQYFWQILTYNFGGEALSSIFSFTTVADVDPVPNPALNPFPPNFALDISLYPQLTWVTGGGEPTGYKIYFDTVNPPQTLIQDGPQSTYFFTDKLSLNTIYFWRVIPYNAIGNAQNCPVWRFTTKTTADPVPNAAKEPAPLDNQTNVSFHPNLYWNNGGGDILGYRVYLDTVNPPLQEVQNSELTHYTPPVLLSGIKYYWQVVPYNENGDALNCPIWSFTIKLERRRTGSCTGP